MQRLTRRTMLLGLSGLAFATAARGEASLPPIAVYRDPNCGCCEGWVAHARASGFPVTVSQVADVAPVKQRWSVPEALWSCHTGRIGRYVLEGHVPADAIRRLLAETPDIAGLAVPGMPSGSPGMDAPGAPLEVYDVVAFGPAGARLFGRYRGTARA